MTEPEPEVAEILSADTAVLVRNPDGTHDIVLIRRGGESEHGKLAFPGGRKKAADGYIRATARRELHEEAGLIVAENDLELFEILDGPGRDPRPGGRTSVVFVTFKSTEEAETAHAGDDASEVVRMPLRDVRPQETAFDHGNAIRRLQRKYP